MAVGQKLLFDNILPKKTRRHIKNMFFELNYELKGNGFNPIRSDHLLNKNELVYNRGIRKNGEENGRSNFFVFVKIKQDEIKVMFTDPDTSPKSLQLAQDEIQIVIKQRGDEREWSSRTVDKILRVSKNKEDNTYFANLHSHWGRIDGYDLLKRFKDDGNSSEKRIIRQLMLYNYDYDMSGHHNHFLIGLAEFVRKKEREVGIRKIAGIELTVPIFKGDRNGPHNCLWFSGFEFADEYFKRHLDDRGDDDYPPWAARGLYLDKIASINSGYRKEGVMAVGQNHPVSDWWEIGLLNLVSKGRLSYQVAVDYVRGYTDAVEGFNAELSNKTGEKLRLNGNNEQIIGLLQKHGFDKKTYPNCLNTAFALEMNREYGKSIYFGTDTHNFLKVKYNSHIHQSGRGFTIIRYPLKARDDGSAKKPDDKKIIEFILSKNAAENIYPYSPIDEKTGDVLRSRRYQSYKMRAKELGGLVEIGRWAIIGMGLSGLSGYIFDDGGRGAIKKEGIDIV